MGERAEYRVAVVQQPSVFLDRMRTIDKVVALVKEVASAGARLVSFPEAFIPGYPEWIGRLRPNPDAALATEIHELLMGEAVQIARGDLNPICEAARKHEITVSVGMQERDTDFSRGTVYNTVVVIGPDGTILNRHRKLTPTYEERMVWGKGDGTGLRVVETPVGRVSTLICWENYIPFARYAMYSQGAEIYVAPTWDYGENWIIAMRFIAVEGRCWVLGNGTSMQIRDVPRGFPGRTQLFPGQPDDWINPGDSVIIDPEGRIVAGPLHEKSGILYAASDPLVAAGAHRKIDVAGHYSRPDIFHFSVHPKTVPPIQFG